MDDDWDLHAVVKGCATSSAGGGSTVSNICTDDFLPCENSEFDFSAFLDDDEKNESFEGLQEIYREFCVDPTLPPRVTAVTVGQVHNLGVVHMSQEENVQLKNPVISSNPIRPRRRKNQQTKVVRELTQEELSADSWAWRKYGQKPIKGSPYPRNYYRCSTSKGCAARKQVERSPNDPLIFIVSYTGEHAHPRPTHRSSLAGSTRNKLKNINTTTNTTNNKLILQNGPSSSFSPNTPLLEGEEATMQNDVVEMEEDEEGTNISNIMMIPNIDDEDEDMFKMFQDSDHSSGAGGDHHLFSTGGLVSSPPWTPTSFEGLDGGGGG